MKIKVFALLMCAVVAGSAGEVDFSAFRNFWSVGGKVQVSPARDSLILSWDPAARRFMEFSFPRLPELGTFEKISIIVTLKKSEKSNLTALALRLLDKDGEIFQFKRKVTADSGQVVFDIDNAALRHNGVWKSSANVTANRKLDFPVRIFGMSVDYPAGAEPGEVAVTSVSWLENQE